jgi:hypothetical protein
MNFAPLSDSFLCFIGCHCTLLFAATPCIRSVFALVFQYIVCFSILRKCTTTTTTAITTTIIRSWHRRRRRHHHHHNYHHHRHRCMCPFVNVCPAVFVHVEVIPLFWRCNPEFPHIIIFMLHASFLLHLCLCLCFLLACFVIH